MFEYLEKKSGGFAIVFLSGNVQGRQSNFASRVVFQEDGHDLVVSLLQSHGERSESVLCGQTLVGAVGQQEADDSVVVLLGRHVERSESILRLDVDGSALEHQDLDHFLLSSCELQICPFVYISNFLKDPQLCRCQTVDKEPDGS